MKILFLLLISFSLWSQTLFEQAKVQFDDGNFTAAYLLYERSSQQEHDEEATFYLGIMSEHGIGVRRDRDISYRWYRDLSEDHYMMAVSDNDHDIKRRRREFARQIELDDVDAKKTVEQKVQSKYGFRAHKENYFLPVSCGDFDYKSYVPSDEYSSCEAEIQLSLGFDLGIDLFGLGEIYTIAYTQRSYWQIYVESKPFRETVYNPEFIITVPRGENFFDVSLRAFVFTLAHQSNGKGDITEEFFFEDPSGSILEEHPEWVQNNSRSWNYLSASAVLQYHALFFKFTGWWRLEEDGDDDDNPDLTDHLGHGSIRLYYPRGRSVSKLMVRHNIRHGKGAVEASWSYPFFDRDSTYWYLKVFSGYGESLIDYDNYVNKFAIGLSFTR